MRRFLAVFAVVTAVLCLCAACNFTSNLSDALGAQTESREIVEKMLQALVEGDTDGALALMHPTTAETASGAVSQMCDFLNGRGVTELTQTSVRVNFSAGTGGKSRQEVASYQVILEDSSEIYVTATYSSDGRGEGFVSFQIVLGVI